MTMTFDIFQAISLILQINNDIITKFALTVNSFLSFISFFRHVNLSLCSKENVIFEICYPCTATPLWLPAIKATGHR